MSIFPGTFTGLPGVSCDRFSGANVNSDQFFLSHCHSDHMVGLDSLVMRLRNLNKVKVNHRIYCSMTSKAFITRKFGFLEEKWVRDLFPNEPVTIHVFDRSSEGGTMYQLRVTTIPARHCPGSVMFLFETLSDSDEVTRRVLYTGDFRFEDVDLSTLKSLHCADNSAPLPIDELYLDTTFCHPRYLTFPTREAAKKCIWEIVHPWIMKNGMYRHQRAKHVVLFHLPAQYGSEDILHYIYQKSNYKWRIHVDKSKFGDYLSSDDLGDCTDGDAKNAEWIHACSWERSADGKKKRPKKSGQLFLREIPCQSGRTFEVCQIRPSAMYFDRERLAELAKQGVATSGTEDKNIGVMKNDGGQYYRVCYSSHSSLTELMEFVRHFKPQKIVPCVQPRGMTLDQVQEVLDSALAEGLERVQDSPVLNALLESASQMPDEARVFPDMGLGSGTRKRRMGDSQEFDVNQSANEPPTKRNAVGEVNANTNTNPRQNSSEEEDDEVCDTAAFLKSKSRRESFQRSKSSRVSYSLPATGRRSQSSLSAPQQNRRASLPHSLKIPAITITPSSPSPDPNHPDYPEFFEDKMYLETLSKCSGSGDQPSTPSTKEEKMEEGDDENSSEEKKPGEGGREEANSSSLEVCYESLPCVDKDGNVSFKVAESPEVIELSSDHDVEDGGGDEELMDSTPELEAIAASAADDRVMSNCANYTKGLEKKQLAEKKCPNVP